MTAVGSVGGIAASDVCKSCADHVALDEVILTADEGTICALLGPNGGAGKPDLT